MMQCVNWYFPYKMVYLYFLKKVTKLVPLAIHSSSFLHLLFWKPWHHHLVGISDFGRLIEYFVLHLFISYIGRIVSQFLPDNNYVDINPILKPGLFLYLFLSLGNVEILEKIFSCAPLNVTFFYLGGLSWQMTIC